MEPQTILSLEEEVVVVAVVEGEGELPSAEAEAELSPWRKDCIKERERGTKSWQSLFSQYYLLLMLKYWLG